MHNAIYTLIHQNTFKTQYIIKITHTKMQEIIISDNETRLIPETELEEIQNSYGLHAKHFIIYKNPNRFGINKYTIW